MPREVSYYTIGGPDAPLIFGVLQMVCEFAAGDGLHGFSAYFDQESARVGVEQQCHHLECRRGLVKTALGTVSLAIGAPGRE